MGSVFPSLQLPRKHGATVRDESTSDQAWFLATKGRMVIYQTKLK